MLKCRGKACFKGVAQYKKCTIQYANEICKSDKMNAKDCKALAFGKTIGAMRSVSTEFVNTFIANPSDSAPLFSTIKYSMAIRAVLDEASCQAAAFLDFSKTCYSHDGKVTRDEMDACMDEAKENPESSTKTPQWMAKYKNALANPNAKNIEAAVKPGQAYFEKFVSMLAELKSACKFIGIFNAEENQPDDDEDGDDAGKTSITAYPGCMRVTNYHAGYGRLGIFSSQATYNVPAKGKYPLSSKGVPSDPEGTSKREKHKVCSNYYRLGKKMAETSGYSLALNNVLSINDYLVDLSKGGKNAKYVDDLLKEDSCMGVDSWTIEDAGTGKEVKTTFKSPASLKLPGFNPLEFGTDDTTIPLSEATAYGRYYVTFDDLQVCSATIVKFKTTKWCCPSYASVAKENGWALPNPNSYDYGSKNYPKQYRDDYRDHSSYDQYDQRNYDGYRAMAGYGDGKEWGFYGDHKGYDSHYDGESSSAYQKVYTSNLEEGYMFSKIVKSSFKHPSIGMKLAKYYQNDFKTCRSGSYGAATILQGSSICRDSIKASCGEDADERVMPVNSQYHSSYVYHDDGEDYYGHKYETKDDKDCPTVLQATTKEVPECEKYAYRPKQAAPAEASGEARVLPAYSYYKKSVPHPFVEKTLQCLGKDGDWHESDSLPTCKIAELPPVTDLRVFLTQKKKFFWCANVQFPCNSNHRRYHTGHIGSDEIISRLEHEVSYDELKDAVTAAGTKEAENPWAKVLSKIGKPDLDLDHPSWDNLKWASRHLEQCEDSDFALNECQGALEASFVSPQLFAKYEVMESLREQKGCFEEREGGLVRQAHARMVASLPDVFASRVAAQHLAKEALDNNSFGDDAAERLQYLEKKATSEGTPAFPGGNDNVAFMAPVIQAAIVDEEDSVAAFNAIIKAMISEEAITSVDNAEKKRLMKKLTAVYSQYKMAANDEGDKAAPAERDGRVRALPVYDDRYEGQDHYASSHDHYYGDNHDQYYGDHHYGKKGSGHHYIIVKKDKTSSSSVSLSDDTSSLQEPGLDEVEIPTRYVGQSELMDTCSALGMADDANELVLLPSNKQCAIETSCVVARYFKCIELTKKSKSKSKDHYHNHGSYYKSDKDYGYDGKEDHYHGDRNEYYRTLLEQARNEASPMELAGLASLGFVAGIATVALIQQGKGLMSKSKQRRSDVMNNADQVQLV
jgi:hypothetical protein